MENGQNLHVDEMIEKIFMQTIEHDLHAFQNGIRDGHSSNKKLLLLHLFIQLYQDSPTKQPGAASNQMDEVMQRVDALQKQADTFLNELEQDEQDSE